MEGRIYGGLFIVNDEGSGWGLKKQDRFGLLGFADLVGLACLTMAEIVLEDAAMKVVKDNAAISSIGKDAPATAPGPGNGPASFACLGCPFSCIAE
jgi:hypothetical protein